MPNLPYKTAGWDTHGEVTLREIDYPLPEEEPDHFTVLRTYEGPESTYADLALDTADTEFATAFFVKQGALRDIGGGCIRYDRLFATVPADWSEPESFAYAFPGLIGVTPSRAAQKTLTASGRLLHEYALSSVADLNTDLPLTDAFSPVDTSGLEVTVLSTGSATTPSSTTYDGWRTAGTELTVECNHRRYMGNIFVRITRLIPAK